MKNETKRILEEAQKQKMVVSIFSDCYDQSSCSVGLVENVTNNDVRLNSISPDGEFAGKEVRPLEAICRIDYGGLYEKKIELLWKNRGNVYKEFSFESSTDESLIIDTIKRAKTESFVVELWTDDKDNSILGYIEDVKEDFIKILSIDEYGRSNGIVYLKTQAVLGVDCGTIRCQKFDFLYKNRETTGTPLTCGRARSGDRGQSLNSE